MGALNLFLILKGLSSSFSVESTVLYRVAGNGD